MVQGIPISIYDVIFAAFKALFEAIQKPETIRDDQYNRTYEIKLWDVWNSVCILPETDHIVASSNQYITIEFCEACKCALRKQYIFSYICSQVSKVSLIILMIRATCSVQIYPVVSLHGASGSILLR